MIYIIMLKTSVSILLILLVFPLHSAGRPATYLRAVKRVIAVGDIHGDFSVFIDVLRGAKLVNKQGKWIGGKSVLVQVGDQLDRGDDDKKILDYLKGLEGEAKKAGGAVYALLGNHEAMNVELDFRYITPKSFKDFDHFYDPNNSSRTVEALPRAQRGRATAFQPGGEYARYLSTHNSVLVIGVTGFVHGGVNEKNALYGIDKINFEMSQWMKGKRQVPFHYVAGDGPLWNRDYSDGPVNCEKLEKTLEILKINRLIVAHTIQPKVNSACGGKVWRVDVGLSSYYEREVLKDLYHFQNDKEYLGLGKSSCYHYLTRECHLSEDIAYRREKIAQICHKFPILYKHLVSGALCETHVFVMSKILKSTEQKIDKNKFIESCLHKSKDQISRDILKMLDPVVKPYVEPVGLPIQKDAPPFERPKPREQIKEAKTIYDQINHKTYSFNITLEIQKDINEVKTFLSGKYPKGATSEQLMAELLQHYKKTKIEKETKFRGKRVDPKGNYIPKQMKEEVLKRMGPNCVFVGENGTVCGSSWDIEFDHIDPKAEDGKTVVKNLRPLCRAHNIFVAEQIFGKDFMKEKIRNASIPVQKIEEKYFPKDLFQKE